jgi:succinate dehydrogenase/fumarate reductase flavoprotein subunit
LRKAGADLAKERIELGPVVQNFNGGIFIDENGFTGVEGLYAAGEVTGGVHGADRPGGNNLSDTQVFGCRAGRAASGWAQGRKGASSRVAREIQLPASLPTEASTRMQIANARAALYERELTIVRTESGLRRVLDFVKEQLPLTANYAERNALLVGQMLALAALTREESRGTHYREDFPATDANFTKRITIHQGSDGCPVATLLPAV